MNAIEIKKLLRKKEHVINLRAKTELKESTDKVQLKNINLYENTIVYNNKVHNLDIIVFLNKEYISWDDISVNISVVSNVINSVKYIKQLIKELD